nr:unnamed protein product [Callosobruchus analis]
MKPYTTINYDKDETLDRTYEPLAVSSFSQDSYKVDIISFSEETEFEVAENNISNTRKRKKIADESEWIRIKNKRLRMKGKAYLGFSKKGGGKVKLNQPRVPRTLKKTCES